MNKGRIKDKEKQKASLRWGDKQRTLAKSVPSLLKARVTKEYMSLIIFSSSRVRKKCSSRSCNKK
jgi:hypothetical protein